MHARPWPCAFFVHFSIVHVCTLLHHSRSVNGANDQLKVISLLLNFSIFSQLKRIAIG